MKELQVYKGGLIKLKIPEIKVNEIGLYRSILGIFLFITLISGKTPKYTVSQLSNGKDNFQIPLTICPIDSRFESKESTSEKVDAKEVKARSDKRIAITEIITDKKVLNYLCHEKRLERAIQASKETGLFVATIIGQKGVESNWNISSLTRKTNNEGNIKCRCNGNKKLRKKHSKEDVCVQAYDKIEKSNHFYVKLKTKWQGWNWYKDLIGKRYSKVKNMETYKEQLDYLKARGYATDKNYSKTICQVIKNNGLDILERYIDEGYTITTETGKYNLN